VGNSIKFTKEGRVSVCLLRDGENQWMIQVSDTGIGIPKEAQSYIFDPFRQANDAITRDNRGIGLGLAITNQLVELMNG
jgi:signal transduction histidine kinase